jgi:glutathione synthase/RimK-type ligase-like ATP-grasp enzyme
MKIGIVTCQAWPHLLDADQDIIIMLSEHDIDAFPVVWDDQSVDYSIIDALLIRSTWDYFEKVDAFTKWLDMVEARNIPCFNSIKTIRANMHKRYLRQLAENSLSIIPTFWIDKGNYSQLETFLGQTNPGEYIIKPAISAGSYLTEKFNYTEANAILAQYKEIIQDVDLMIQPYIQAIEDSGEVSLLYFNGQYSHSVIKTPKEGDFRIQSQYGGVYNVFEPKTELIHFGLKAIEILAEGQLYGRVDMVKMGDQYTIMEVELIEPDLYFSIHPLAKKTFVDQLVQMCQKL